MSRLPEIEIVIDGMTYEHTFNDDVMVDRTNLDEEFATQAEKYAFYAFLAVRAKNAYEHEKFALEQIYAAIDHEKRSEAEQMKAQNPKFKYTEKMVEGEVITDQRYKAKKNAVMDAKLLSEQLEKAAAAIAQRKDMLIQLGLGARIGNAPTRAVEQQANAAHEVIAQNQQAKKDNNNPANAGSPRPRRKPRSATQ